MKSAKELATEREAKRQKLEEDKRMMDGIPENVQAVMMAMNANTVAGIAGISTELTPKLDLMTVKIDEHNKTLTNHKKDVERSMKKMEKKFDDKITNIQKQIDDGAKTSPGSAVSTAASACGSERSTPLQII